MRSRPGPTLRRISLVSLTRIVAMKALAGCWGSLPVASKWDHYPATHHVPGVDLEQRDRDEEGQR